MDFQKTEPKIEIKLVDYNDPKDAQDLVEALDTYARDIMGGGKPLINEVKTNLCNELSKLPHAFSLLMYVDKKLAGATNCFEGFSTFACRKLINIHDFMVFPQFRGLRLSQKLLAAVEAEGRKRDCCKITLEVLEGNTVARKAYEKFGFASYELDSSTGAAMFMHKGIKG